MTEKAVTVVLDTTLTPALIEEGFVREIISKLQTMRKEAGFEVMDHITVYVSGNERVGELVARNADEICHDCMADGVIMEQQDGYIKEWDINGETVTLAVKRV